MKDNSDHTVEPASRLVCRQIARALIEKYDWALLGEDELVDSVLGSVQSEALPSELTKLVKHHYTIALYLACWQARDPERRERGYLELQRHLFRAAYNRWPELAEDATQRALVLVYEQIDRCRNPGTFLAFALNKLRHAFQQEQRARDDERLLEKMRQGKDEQDWIVSPLKLGQQERQQILQDAIRRLPDERKQQVIYLKFFDGLSDEEIGARLEISAGHVRALRHRGLKKLRQDERLKDYFELERGERL